MRRGKGWREEREGRRDVRDRRMLGKRYWKWGEGEGKKKVRKRKRWKEGETEREGG